MVEVVAEGLEPSLRWATATTTGGRAARIGSQLASDTMGRDAKHFGVLLRQSRTPRRAGAPAPAWRPEPTIAPARPPGFHSHRSGQATGTRIAGALLAGAVHAAPWHRAAPGPPARSNPWSIARWDAPASRSASSASGR